MIFAESRDQILNNLDNHRGFGILEGLSSGSRRFRPEKYFLTQNHQVLTKTKFLYMHSVSMNRVAPPGSTGGA